MEHKQHWKLCNASWRAGGCVALAATVTLSVHAQPLDQEPANKSGYHLFNPVPRERMRELSADRPDQTESAYTVDAGHFQMEADIVSATFDHDTSGGADLKTQDWTAGAINLKAGLLNNVDIQFVFDSWTKSRIEDGVANTVTEAEGTGDLQTRLKINLWGNDGGRTALAVMPFVKWPLSESAIRNGETEGGIILPFAADLGGGWGFGTTTEFDFVSDGNGGRDTEYFNTITVSHDLFGGLGGYVEFAALVTPESGNDWQGQFDIGFTYGFGENTQLDCGCNFGVTESAPDFNPFLGITFRY